MGKGRDKRKKHEDPTKALKRAEKVATRVRKAGEKEDVTEGGVALYGEEDIVTTVAKMQKREAKKKVVTETEKVKPPTPRANAIFIPHPTKDNEVVMFGGEMWDGVNTVAYNDLYIYGVAKDQWRHINAPLTPSPRSSAQAVTYKQYMLVVGGEFVSQSQSQFLHFRDTWRFNFGNSTWDELKIKNGPSARSGHRMVSWKRNQAVLFGGFYDNALETRYYDDLWVLSDLDGVGKWTSITFPDNQEAPVKRSGHALAIHEDKVFVYGGYSTAKLNRFGKTEATVHHDLWVAPLEGAAMWTKIKLAGIPPPIRSGLSFCQKEKKLYLFGGVVDIDAPGGKQVSSFQNDIYVLQLDTQRFYPLMLNKPKKLKGAGVAQKAQTVGGGDLTANLAALGGGESTDEDSDDEDKKALDEVEHKFSHIENPLTGQVFPCGRMQCMMNVSGHTMYLYGGQYERNKKEVTLADLLSLNLNKMESWVPHVPMNLTDVEKQWKAKDEEKADSDCSWETGSTVLDTDEIARLAELDADGDGSESDDDDTKHKVGEGGSAIIMTGGASSGKIDLKSALKAGVSKADDVEEEEADSDGESIPTVVPAPADFSDVPLGVDSRTTVKGKVGRKVHKDQLKAQLGSTAVVPSPELNENVKEFYKRTEHFWMASAREALLGDPAEKEEEKVDAATAKQLKNSAFQFAKRRHEEAILLMEQIALVEEQQREEDITIRQHIADKKKRMAERLAEDEESEEENDQ